MALMVAAVYMEVVELLAVEISWYFMEEAYQILAQSKLLEAQAVLLQEELDQEEMAVMALFKAPLK